MDFEQDNIISFIIKKIVKLKLDAMHAVKDCTEVL
jgi:hypothetical protein